MKMLREEKKDKIRYIVLVQKQNVLFNQILPPLSTHIQEQKIEIQTNYMRDFQVGKDPQIGKEILNWDKTHSMTPTQAKNCFILKQGELLSINNDQIILYKQVRCCMTRQKLSKRNYRIKVEQHKVKEVENLIQFLLKTKLIK